jgi:hypothetical protein
LKTITKEIRQGDSIFALNLFADNGASKLTTSSSGHAAFTTSLCCYFQGTHTAPSSREVDHCIPFKEGTEPVNVRPDRYAYFQKAEIEKQVLDIIEAIRTWRPHLLGRKFYIQTD